MISYQLRSRLGVHQHLGERSTLTTFAPPLQSYLCTSLNIDRPFFDALCSDLNPDWLQEALDFYLLATRDEQFLNESYELILMASAYERLLGASDSTGMQEHIRNLLAPYRSEETVASLRSSGKSVSSKSRDREVELAFANAPPHEGWAVDFYNARNRVVHRRKLKEAAGWTSWEHLLMAGHLFPLLVKLKLMALGHYALTSSDEERLHAIDPLLAAPSWEKDTDSSPWFDIHRTVVLRQSILSKIEC